MGIATNKTETQRVEVASSDVFAPVTSRAILFSDGSVRVSVEHGEGRCRQIAETAFARWDGSVITTPGTDMFLSYLPALSAALVAAAQMSFSFAGKAAA